MTDLLLQFGISNLCVSLALALLAWAVQRTGRQPVVAYVLWLLVLIKLVTPPLVTVPVVPVPGLAVEALSDPAGFVATSADMLVPGRDVSVASADRGVVAVWLAAHGKLGLILIWLIGGVCVFGWSLARICRFHRLLKTASEVAPRELQRVASEVAQRVGLERAPTIHTTAARISPMVWWLGGRVRIVIPAALQDELDAGQLRWVLAHELAHVRRRDHLVRWLEWLACVCFWWNPVAWWARRNLRINEEICCDALVLSSLKPNPHNYANSLMTVIEFLASPVIRPPAMASEISSGGFLERRFRMIISDNPIARTPRWLIAGVLLTALTLLPLGVTYAQGAGQDRGERIARALHEAGVDRLVIRDVMGAMERVVHEIKAEGEDFELDPRLREYLVSLELTDEQIELVIDLSRRVAAAKSDEDAIWGRVARALHEGGIERLKIRDVMGAMRRVVHEIKAEGDEFELDPRLREYLVSLELTDEQIELVIGLSRRVAAAKSDEDAMWGRVARALHEGGIERLKIRDVMGAMRRIVHEMKAEGDDFELDPRLREHLVSRLELTDEQIELVIGLSRRVAAAKGDDDARGRIIQVLMENGIARENVEGVMGVLRYIAGEIHRQGDAFELHPGVRERLVHMNLTDEQIDLVVGLAHRRASAR